MGVGWGGDGVCLVAYSDRFARTPHYFMVTADWKEDACTPLTSCMVTADWKEDGHWKSGRGKRG